MAHIVSTKTGPDGRMVTVEWSNGVIVEVYPEMVAATHNGEKIMEQQGYVPEELREEG